MLGVQKIKEIYQGQQGAIGMLIVIGFMALALPVTTSALNLAGTFSKDSQVKTRIAKNQYSAVGVAEYVRYLMDNPDGWDEWIDDTGGVDEVTINGEPIDFTVTEIQDPPDYSPESEIRVKKEGIAQGDLISGGADIKIDKEVVLTGNIRAGKDVILDKESSITGDIISGGNVTIKKDATVTGNVTAAGAITLEQGAVVTGTQTPNEPNLPDIVPASLLVDAFVDPGTTDVTVAEEGSLNLAAESYGRLLVEKEATLTLNSGHYSFSEFKVDKEAILNLDLGVSGIPVTIDVNGKELKIDKEAQMTIVSSGGDFSDILFRVKDKVRLDKEGQFLGTFLTLGGPKYQVTVTDSGGDDLGSFDLWLEQEDHED